MEGCPLRWVVARSDGGLPLGFWVGNPLSEGATLLLAHWVLFYRQGDGY
jgi:hypothetical protein